jgi:hypothetical protein
MQEKKGKEQNEGEESVNKEKMKKEKMPRDKKDAPVRPTKKKRGGLEGVPETGPGLGGLKPDLAESEEVFLIFVCVCVSGCVNIRQPLSFSLAYMRTRRVSVSQEKSKETEVRKVTSDTPGTDINLRARTHTHKMHMHARPLRISLCRQICPL